MDTTEAYAQTRRTMTEIVRSLDPADGRRPVPACPRWTVQELFSHAVGVSADILAGDVGGAGSDAWTQAQVEARRGRSLAELADEWDETGPEVEAKLVGLLPAQAVFDQVTHEHDLRGAVDRPGGQDSAALAIGFGFVEQHWPATMAARGLAPVRLVAGDVELVVGDGGSTTVRLSRFEALRALTGRRSLDQVRAYDWGADPEPWLSAFTWGPFTPTPVALAH
ncbi:maleylpyruvate isomerase N-terminal domain-containing protein [Aquihabitans sp. G128]|uniref:maleylpyruvate isomerase N-terminal domain-containing protein n=1 Tax=Aquihabitans sp. G128 TaxID=2849779 RepID=UPI001C21171C|nr:maleylpyruvate isomerase N-terminal domain-containing protein [Aquihabitans sp. G128]QXC59864.1 maleylpyruvate isomerase N-terminal domain-containing protein [Aquihabitans sp. G128]